MRLNELQRLKNSVIFEFLPVSHFFLSLSIMNAKFERRDFLTKMLLISGATVFPGGVWSQIQKSSRRRNIRFGLVTYMWGHDLELPELIELCTTTGVTGVELRVDHAHGVTPELSKDARKEIRRRFRGSPVEVVGMGTNQQFDQPDRNDLRASIDRTVEYIKLSSDIGGSGVKVKPNQFHPGVPRSRTIEQIGRALGQLARVGLDYGQQIRLEVHGRETQEINIIKDIMDVADHPNATVCWNSNDADLRGRGFAGNFELLKDRLGGVVHVRELNRTDYPYAELIQLLADNNYRGWVMLEGHQLPADRNSALLEQRKIFDTLLTNALTI